MGIPYKINPRLVRGLDYYTQTVFEWVTEALGAQGTVCGGGRYDGLLSELGAKEPVGAIGFSLGIERVLALMALEPLPIEPLCDIYVIVLGEQARARSLELTELWRGANHKKRWCLDCVGGSLKSQLKRADKSGAAIAVILDEALAQAQVSIKFLREDRPQLTVPLSEMIEQFI